METGSGTLVARYFRRVRVMGFTVLLSLHRMLEMLATIWKVSEMGFTLSSLRDPRVPDGLPTLRVFLDYHARELENTDVVG